MKILTIVGARPQFIKAALLSAELERRNCAECLVHTGQHYDFEMSGSFFEQLKLKEPDHHLGVGSGSHAVQTGEMMKRLEPVISNERPSWVVVYGDTNSTLAGALVAAKLRVPIAHVEAGLRSFNRDMPEEVNRIIADHVASLLFAPTTSAAQQLAREGVVEGVHVVGDLMVDLVLSYASTIPERPAILNRFAVEPYRFALVTVHRAVNTESELTFSRIVDGLKSLPFPVIFPVHPRTATLAQMFASNAPNVILCEPLPYFDTIALQSRASVVITDSGGIQKEAYALGVPCVTLRDETEWTETLHDGWNVLVGNDPASIAKAARRPKPLANRHELFGNGTTASRIAELLMQQTQFVRAAREPNITVPSVLEHAPD